MSKSIEIIAEKLTLRSRPRSEQFFCEDFQLVKKAVQVESRRISRRGAEWPAFRAWKTNDRV
jgi:hypothetical protein